MEKLNELAELAERADSVGNLMDAVNPHTILAISEAFRALEQEVQKNLDGALAWQQRAEAAEAKLTEKGAPGAMRVRYHPSPCCAGSWVYADIDKFKADTSGRYQEQELFTRAAADLAELVPEKASMADYYENVRSGEIDPEEAGIAMWDACRAAILRNIEEASKK